MKAKIYVGAKKYALYIGRKIIDKTLEFLTLPARFISKKVQDLKKYFIYGKSIQSNLPENYIQLEYIEGTGEQYIITDFFFDNIATDTLTCDFMRTGTGAGSLLYGCRDAYKVNGYGFQFNDTGRTYRQYGDTDTGLGNTAVKNLNTRYTVKQTGYTYTIDGNSSAVVASDPVQNYPLTVFATRSADAPITAITPMRLYNLNVVTTSGNIILNLIPARRNDGVLGLYDTVANKFYTNVGTGEFIAGNAMRLPEGYTQLEYIVADGKAYVDTGFKANTTTTRFVGAFRLTDTSVSQGFFGSRNAKTADSSSCLVLYAVSGSYVRGDWISGNASSSVLVTGNTIITFDVTRDYGVINGGIYTSTSSASIDQINNFYVGHFRNGDGTMFGSGVIGHIFPCQLISNGTVIRNLVPAKRNSDEKIGMYDIENDVFYPSAGESEFTAGPVFSLKPTPLNPIEIKSVGEKTVNLFNKETIIKGKYISQAGTATSSASFCYGDYINVVPNNEYVISGTNKGGTAYRRIHAYGIDKKWLQQIKALQVQGGADYIMTFTAPEDCAYIRFSGMSATNDYEETNTIQIQEGSVVTTYEPYGYKIPVNVTSKNLFNPTSSRNAYLQSPTVGRGVDWKTSTATTTYINCNRVEAGKTYTISCMTNQLVATTARAGAIVGDDDLIKQVILTPEWIVGKNEYSFVATDDGWLYVAVDINSTDISVREFNETNIYLSEPLRKLGDLTDYIDFENQKVIRQVGAEKFGTADWTYESTYTRFSREFSTLKSVGTRMTYMTSDGFIAFTAGTGIATVPNNTFYTGASTSKYLYFKTDVYDTVSAFTNAMSETYVYFPITPTEETINLPAISLPQDTITVDTDTEIKPSKLTITGDIDNE